MASLDTAPPVSETSAPQKPQSPSGTMASVIFVILALIIIPFTYKVSPLDELKVVLSVFIVVCLFNIMIIVHELGHFLAALWCGMRVEKFALWFGKPLWSKNINGVEYILGSIPLGGYVALPQMVNPESLEGKVDTEVEKLPPVSPLNKAIVAFAGPFFSFLLAIFFACIVTVVGKVDADATITTTIGYVKPGSGGDIAGLKVLDQVKTIGGIPVKKWQGTGGVTQTILFSTTDDLPIEVVRDGKPLTFVVHPSADPSIPHAWYDRAHARVVGIGAKQDLIIKKLDPFGPADRANLKPGDQIVAVNGTAIYSPALLGDLLETHPNDPIKFTYVRDGKTSDVTVTPMAPTDRLSLPKDGPPVDLGMDIYPRYILINEDPITQVSDNATLVGRVLFALLGSAVTPHSNLGLSQMSTPVGIVSQLSTILLQDYGINMVLYLAMAINVNLAIFNLLPLPILDGGHITVAIIEMIRRRPTNVAILEPLQLVTVGMFFCLFLYVVFFDVQDLTQTIIYGVHKKTFPEPTARVST